MRRKMKKNNNKLFRLLLAFLFVFNVGFSATNLVFAGNTNFIHVHVEGDASAVSTVQVVWKGITYDLDNSGGSPLYSVGDNKEFASSDITDVKINGKSVSYELGNEGGGTVNLKVTYAAEKAFSIKKTADKKTANVGDTIKYTITVTNTGETELKDIVVNDALTGIKDYKINSLASGGSTEIKTSYTVIAADAGKTVKNTAEATCSLGTKSYSAETDIGQVTEPKSDFSIVKIADKEKANIGDTINYTITVTNTGETELKDIVVNDALTGIKDYKINSLASGGSTEIKTSYTVIAADAGKTVKNTAEATCSLGTKSYSAETDIGQVTEPKSDFSIVKIADKEKANIGDTINYTITVTNTGETELKDIVVNDALTGIKDYKINSLASGDSTEIKTSYTVIATDAGKTVKNTVEATCSLGTKSYSAETDIGQVTEPKSDFSIVKIADKEKANIGDTINYTITVKNTGDTTLTNIVVIDILTEMKPYTITSLAPGQSVDIPTSYKVKVMDGVSITNTAVATWGEASKSAYAVVKIESEGNPEEPVPGLSITKKADRSSAHRGDTIVYTITVKNTGDTNLEGINVVDGMLNLNQSIKLKSGESKTFDNLNYLVPSDQPYGTLTNTATATCDDLNASDTADVQIVHKSSGGGSSSNDHNNGGTTIDDGTTPLGPADLPALLVTKTVDKASAAPGETVKYTITVKNSGNVDLTNVAVTDQLVGLNETVATLKAGDSKTFSKDYVVPQNAAGSIKNTALAETVYNGNKVTANGSAVTYIQEEVIPDNTPLGDAKFPTETINDSKTPLAEAKLPKTGGIPMSDLVVLGSGLAALGFVLRKRQ